MPTGVGDSVQNVAQDQITLSVDRFSKIDNEILRIILRHHWLLSKSSIASASTVVALNSICHRFRAVLEEVPELWTTISNVMNDETLAKYIHHSMALPLTVRIFISRRCKSLLALRECCSRWEEVHVICNCKSERAWMNSFVRAGLGDEAFQSLRLTNLAVLNVQYSKIYELRRKRGENQVECYPEECLHFYKSWKMPCLRTAGFSGVVPHMNACKKLTTISFTATGQFMLWPDFIEVLGKCRHLERLDLNIGNAGSNQPFLDLLEGTEGTSVALRNLRHLYLAKTSEKPADPTFLGRLIERMAMPNLSALFVDMYVPYDPYAEDWIRPFFAREDLFPDLRELYLRVNADPDPSVDERRSREMPIGGKRAGILHHLTIEATYISYISLVDFAPLSVLTLKRCKRLEPSSVKAMLLKLYEDREWNFFNELVIDECPLLTQKALDSKANVFLMFVGRALDETGPNPADEVEDFVVKRDTWPPKSAICRDGADVVSGFFQQATKNCMLGQLVPKIKRDPEGENISSTSQIHSEKMLRTHEDSKGHEITCIAHKMKYTWKSSSSSETPVKTPLAEIANSPLSSNPNSEDLLQYYPCLKRARDECEEKYIDYGDVSPQHNPKRQSFSAEPMDPIFVDTDEGENVELPEDLSGLFES